MKLNLKYFINCFLLILSLNSYSQTNQCRITENHSGWNFYLIDGFVPSTQNISTLTNVYNTNMVPNSYNHSEWITKGLYSSINYSLPTVLYENGFNIFRQSNLADDDEYSTLSQKDFFIDIDNYRYSFLGSVIFKKDTSNPIPISQSNNESYFQLKITVLSSTGNVIFTDINKITIQTNNYSLDGTSIWYEDENYKILKINKIYNLEEIPDIFCDSGAIIRYEVSTSEEDGFNISTYFTNYCSSGNSLMNLTDNDLNDFPCKDVPYSFLPQINSGGIYEVKFNGNPQFTVSTSGGDYVFPYAGSYTISYTYESPNGCEISYSNSIQVMDCPCKYCTSFELIDNKEYIISGWVSVREDDINFKEINSLVNFEDCRIEIEFFDDNNNSLMISSFSTSGVIIDGWQKIKGNFIVPIGASEISIKLINDSSKIVLFDDIRVHPKDGTMKSFVYDQETKKLMAELDDNNFATFYEYDKEGGLIRVKKETEKGIFTIKETRSNTIKND